ncbi:MAG: response regulator [Desulfobacterales bacterium]|nr:response regulator [Desulfobacterales bacterium]
MKTVLIVDDEIVQIETLKRGLRTRGCRVLDALGGKQALAHLEQVDEIDLVITDYAMPEMNGMELLEKIRKKNKTLPVIMMTAYGDKDLVVEAMRHRCDGFLDKPFTLQELLEVINGRLI